MNNPYLSLAYLSGNPEARSLAEELIHWHDRMVAHLRRHGACPPYACCPNDDCPGEEASALWPLAQRVFGQRAAALTFLSAQAGAKSQ